MAILSNDIALLCKCSGVGKKTAERIILELRDKIDENSIVNDESKITNINSILEEVTEACVTLGYNKYEVRNALALIDEEDLEIEEIIKLVLRKLAN
jgi:Holliday junction DNA helicase RuvA